MTTNITTNMIISDCCGRPLEEAGDPRCTHEQRCDNPKCPTAACLRCGAYEDTRHEEHRVWACPHCGYRTYTHHDPDAMGEGVGCGWCGLLEWELDPSAEERELLRQDEEAAERGEDGGDEPTIAAGAQPGGCCTGG